jgi:hypothetical protein
MSDDNEGRFLAELAAEHGIATTVSPAVPDKGPAATRSEPFHVFVRSVDEVLLTIQLPNGPETTLGRLRDMIEGRTSLSLAEHKLMVGTKPFNAAHVKLPVAAYGIDEPGRTLTLQGSLKGGFGERAAMADTIQRDIVHGNVLGDIEESGGESKAKVGFCRRLLKPKKLGQEFQGRLFKKLQEQKALPEKVTTEEDLQNWMKMNMPFLSATASSNLKAGNCGEYADVAYTSLVSKTQNQTVYKVVMAKPDYDHAFAVTCPNDHGTDIGKLYSDKEAMVVDPWWEGTICTFKKFADGHNPYSEKVDPATKLQIVNHAAATGKPPLSKAFESAMNDVVSGLFKDKQDGLAKQTKRNKDKAQRIADADKQVATCKKHIEEIYERLRKLPSDPKDGTNEKQQVEQAKQELVKAGEELGQAEEEWENAKAALPGVFGTSGETWNRKDIKDNRKLKDLFGTLDRALERGDTAQLEAEMEHVKDVDFLKYLAKNPATMHKVLGSDMLGQRFQQHLDMMPDRSFQEVCNRFTPEEYDKYIKDNSERLDRIVHLAGTDDKEMEGWSEESEDSEVEEQEESEEYELEESEDEDDFELEEEET